MLYFQGVVTSSTTAINRSDDTGNTTTTTSSTTNTNINNTQPSSPGCGGNVPEVVCQFLEEQEVAA